MFTDTHCHLYFNLYQNDLDAVLDRAWERGVKRILIPGTDLDTSQQALALSERDERLFAAIGVHPNDCSDWTDNLLDNLREMAHHPRVKAIGEIGLDYYREHAPHDLQKHVLQAQLDLAAELGLPVIIHNRSSWEDLWPMLKAWQVILAKSGTRLAERPGVFHSFDGTRENAQDVMDHNFFLGISGPVTFKNAPDRQQLVASLPLEAILTETDAPYLTPQPFRGRRNEPAHVAFVTEKIAELHHQPATLIAEETYQNAARLFRWDNID